LSGDQVRRTSKALVAIALCLPSATARAQEPAQEPAPSPPSPRVVADSAAPKWKLNFLPVLGAAPETGLQYGVALFATRAHPTAGTRPSSIVSHAIRTARGQARAFVELDRWTADNDWRYSGLALWQEFPLPFYGIGEDAPEDAREVYTPRGTELAATVQRRVGRAQWAQFNLRRSEVAIVRTAPGGMLEPGTLTGSRGGRVVLATAGAITDTRDNLFAPKQGVYGELSLGTSHDAIGSEFDFQRVRAEFRQYFLRPRGQVVALQSVLQGVSSGAPFDLLSTVGSSSIMRGYVPGRFRDRWMVAAQAEYRSGMRYSWGYAAFAGVGSVARTFDAVWDARLFPSFGGGVRYRMDPRTGATIRVDYAVGTRGQSGLYVSFSEAF
jgi:hypothetical protein